MSNSTALSFWQDLDQNGILAAVERLSDQESIEMAERYGTHNYHPLPVNVVRAKGVYAYDGDGKEYIDCIGCYSAVAHGHLSEFVSETAKKQLDKVTLVSRAMYTSELGLFLKAVCQYTEMDMACPMNTGAEAVETAIKLARKWAYTVKGVPDNQAEIIVGAENFHGRTTTIVGFSSEPQYKAHFGPFAPGFKMVPFGDVEALRAAITPNTAAVLMEPIQAEGGIIFPPEGYLAAVRSLCTDQNVLLIWDEIQTGFCRTGKKFAWMHEDAKPDMICLGKALGGGIYPVAAVAGKKAPMSVFKPGDHGSTFGGNPLAAVIAIAAMAELEVDNLAEASKTSGEYLVAELRKLDSPHILEVRGQGLLVGLEVKEGVDTQKLADAFIREGVLTKETRHRTFRYAPPLVIEREVLDAIVEKTKRALASL
ncbi:MAG: ornithine--oxo-acid transaminase [Fimbriimonadales bacterium]